MKKLGHTDIAHGGIKIVQSRPKVDHCKHSLKNKKKHSEILVDIIVYKIVSILHLFCKDIIKTNIL